MLIFIIYYFKENYNVFLMKASKLHIEAYLKVDVMIIFKNNVGKCNEYV